VIEVGTHFLRPDTADQVIELRARAAGPVDGVTGFNLRAQIGDGLGDDPEPVFSTIDFGGDTVWSSQDVSLLGGPVAGAPQFAQASVVLNESGVLVPSEGIIARLHIDTTGILEGNFALLLEGTQIGLPSVFIRPGGDDLVPSIQNGMLRIWEDRCGDFDRDADVDAADQTTLILNWTGALEPGAGGATFEQGDCDADGDVDSADFTGLILEWTGAMAGMSAAGSDAALLYDSATGQVELGSSAALRSPENAVALSSVSWPLPSRTLEDRSDTVDGAELEQVSMDWVQPLTGAAIGPGSRIHGVDAWQAHTGAIDWAARAGVLGAPQEWAVLVVPEPVWAGRLGWLLAALLIPVFRRHTSVEPASAMASR
jgi:hypothetical protein